MFEKMMELGMFKTIVVFIVSLVLFTISSFIFNKFTVNKNKERGMLGIIQLIESRGYAARIFNKNMFRKDTLFNPQLFIINVNENIIYLNPHILNNQFTHEYLKYSLYASKIKSSNNISHNINSIFTKLSIKFSILLILSSNMTLQKLAIALILIPTIYSISIQLRILIDMIWSIDGVNLTFLSLISIRYIHKLMLIFSAILFLININIPIKLVIFSVYYKDSIRYISGILADGIKKLERISKLKLSKQ